MFDLTTFFHIKAKNLSLVGQIFIEIDSLLVTGINNNWKNWLLATNSNFLNFVPLQPAGKIVEIQLWLFNLTEFMALNILGLLQRAQIVDGPYILMVAWNWKKLASKSKRKKT